MDEGFTTFFTVIAREDYFGRYNNAYNFTEWYQEFFIFRTLMKRAQTQLNGLWLAKTGYEEPIATHSYRFGQPGISGTSIYSKTATVLFMLQYVLGDDVFEKVMREYFNRWKSRHPYPKTFMPLLKEASGRKNMRWFFDQWFHKTSTCDYGISGFHYDGNPQRRFGYLQNEPVGEALQACDYACDVQIAMGGGSNAVVWFPIDLWLNAETERDTVIELQSITALC